VARSLYGGPGNLMVGPGGPTWQPLFLHFNLVSSGVFYSLLVHISSRLGFVPFFHFNPPFLVFWNNPAENINSPKLVEIVSLNP
jgi:hypothetical protein